MPTTKSTRWKPSKSSWTNSSPRAKPDQVAIAIPTAEQLVDQAVAADRFDIAVVLATTASKAVAKSKIATHKEVEERLSRRRHDIHLLEPIYAAAKKAQETLEKTPADAEANLTVGRWLCFYKGDWTAGLPMLAKGSDEKLKALAEQEIKSPTDADQQVTTRRRLVGPGPKRSRHRPRFAPPSCRQHLSRGDAESGVGSEEGGDRKAIGGNRRSEASRSHGAPRIILAPRANRPATIKFPLNKWVDVLRFVDTTKNAVKGKWSRERMEISCDAQDVAVIQIPVIAEGSYEIEIEFTRTAGDGDVNSIFVVGSHQCNAQISANGGRASGLSSVDGRHCTDHGNPTHIIPGQLRMAIATGCRSKCSTCDPALLAST